MAGRRTARHRPLSDAHLLVERDELTVHGQKKTWRRGGERWLPGGRLSCALCRACLVPELGSWVEGQEGGARAEARKPGQGGSN